MHMHNQNDGNVDMHLYVKTTSISQRTCRITFDLSTQTLPSLNRLLSVKFLHLPNPIIIIIIITIIIPTP